MIFAIIMFICSASLAGAFYYCFIAAGEVKKQILLGVTLPDWALELEAVRKIAKDYKKKINRCMGILLLIGIPVHAAMAGYLSIFLIIYMVWAVLLYWLPYQILKKEHDRLYRMKCENHWTVGKSGPYILTPQQAVLQENPPFSHSLFGFCIALPASSLCKRQCFSVFSGRNGRGDICNFPANKACIFFVLFLFYEREK